MSAASDQYERRTLDAIRLPEGRQRSDLDLDENFLRSIRLRGILCPLLVRSDGRCV